MDKSKKREHVFSQTTSIDMSNIKEHIDCIQAFLESPYFENQLMSL
jgi:hypothetical protein